MVISIRKLCSAIQCCCEFDVGPARRVGDFADEQGPQKHSATRSLKPLNRVLLLPRRAGGMGDLHLLTVVGCG
jgi:hypothetical protein